MKNRDLGLVVAAGALVLDQGFKLLMLFAFGFAGLAPGESVSLLPFFDLVMVWNPGITFGLFPANSLAGTVVLASFQILAISALLWWLWSAKKKILVVGIGLVVGGALGNLIDRLIYGKVADFFHFHVAGFNWYVFNIADTAITIGVAGLLYEALSNSDSSAPKADRKASKE
jgi:signal peptidase II